ncbi:hypothetical protein K1719_019423 [Acacia pycnantha]|nr:hypothetical protein K1719_019423 [Acacia pycnantha]
MGLQLLYSRHLSNQDTDSIPLLREFCYALYLMERYRESRTLPPSLPNNILYDEMLLSLTTASVPSERVISFDMRGSNANAWWYKLEYIIMELNINSVTTTPCHEEILPINSWKHTEKLNKYDKYWC